MIRSTPPAMDHLPRLRDGLGHGDPKAGAGQVPAFQAPDPRVILDDQDQLPTGVVGPICRVAVSVVRHSLAP